MAKVDRTVLISNDQDFGQVADPNKLETQITHAFDKIDENDNEFIAHKKQVDPTSADITRDKHVSNNDLKVLQDQITNNLTDLTNHKKQVDPTSSDATRDKHVANNDLKTLQDQITTNNTASISRDNTHKNAVVLDHPDQSVTTSKIKDLAVTSGKIATGAVGRNQLDPTLFEQTANASKFQEIDAQLAEIVSINVKSFGAKGDGVTDDTIAIQSAIDSANGKEIWFINGTFLTTGVLRYQSNTKLRGHNATIIGDTILFSSKPTTTYHENVSFVGLTFQRKTLAYNDLDRLIILQGCKNVEVKQCYFKGYNGDAIVIDLQYNTTLVPENIQIQNNVFDGLGAENRNAISIFQGKDIFIQKNKFKNMGKSDQPGCICVEPWNYSETLVMVQNLYIEENEFDNIVGSAAVNIALDYGDLNVKPFSHFVISKNVFKNIKQNFIYLGDTLSTANEETYRFTHDIIVEGNHFTGVSDGIFFDMTISGIRGCIVRNNTFENTVGTIFIGKHTGYGYKKCINLIVEGNKFFNPSPNGVDDKTLFRVGAVENLSISNNTVFSNNPGTKTNLYIIAYMTGANITGLKKNIVRDNVIVETGGTPLFPYFMYYPTNSIEIAIRDNIIGTMSNLMF